MEEFHLSLQEVTHFPLRPFVLPFLRSHVPLLTRELSKRAQRAGMVGTIFLFYFLGTVLFFRKKYIFLIEKNTVVLIEKYSFFDTEVGTVFFFWVLTVFLY